MSKKVFKDAQANLANEMHQACLVGQKQLRDHYFIPDLSDGDVSDIDLSPRAQPVMATFLPADAVKRGSSLTPEHGVPCSPHLRLAHLFFFLLAWLPQEMQAKLKIVSVAFFDKSDPPELPDAPVPAPVPPTPPVHQYGDEGDEGGVVDEVGGDASLRSSPGSHGSDEEESHEESREAQAANPLSPEDMLLIRLREGESPPSRIPDKDRRFLGTLILVQENGAGTWLDDRFFPLSDTRGLDTLPENDDGESQGEDGEEPQTKRSKPDKKHLFRVPLHVAMRSVLKTYWVLVANENATGAGARINGSGIGKRLSDSFPVKTTRIDPVCFRSFTDLTSVAQECMHTIFRSAGEMRGAVDARTREFKETGVSIFSYTNVMRQVEANLGRPVNWVFGAYSGGKVVQREYIVPGGIAEEDTGLASDQLSPSTPSSVGETLYERHFAELEAQTREQRAFRDYGMMTWKWVVPKGEMESFFTLFGMRIPTDSFTPQVPLSIAYQYLAKVCKQEGKMAVLRELEELPANERTARIYYLLFGPAYGHPGVGPYFGVTPDLGLYGFDEASDGGITEDVVEVMLEWAQKTKKLSYTSSRAKNAHTVTALLEKFVSHGGGIVGFRHMCEFPTKSHSEVHRVIARRDFPKGAFNAFLYNLMHKNGMNHTLPYHAMVFFCNYAATGHRASLSTVLQGGPGTGKSTLLSILKALCGRGFISALTDACMLHYSNPATFGQPGIFDEALNVIHAAPGSHFSSSPARNSACCILENMGMRNTQRALVPDGKTYDSSVSSVGRAMTTLCFAYNERIDSLDWAVLDRVTSILTSRSTKLAKKEANRRSLAHADGLFNLQEANDPDSLVFANYIAQVVRLKGFSELLLNFPQPCDAFFSPKSIELMQEKYRAEGGVLAGDRMENAAVEMARMRSAFDAVLTGIRVNKNAQRRLKDHDLIARMVVDSIPFHIPTGVDYAVALSILMEECDGNMRFLLLGLLKQALVTSAPGLLLDTWNEHSVRVPSAIFSLSDAKKIDSAFEQYNYMALGEPTVHSLVHKLRAFTNIDRDNIPMLRICNDSIDISYWTLRHSFTQREIHVFGEICNQPFFASFAKLLCAIGDDLYTRSVESLQASRPGARYVEEESQAAWNPDEDSNHGWKGYAGDVGAPAAASGGGDAGDAPSSQYNSILFDPKDAEKARQVFSTVCRHVKSVLTKSEYSEVKAKKGAFYGAAYVLIQKYVDAFSGMKSGGEPVVESMKSAYWHASVEYLSQHKDGFFDDVVICFTADELRAGCSVFDGSLDSSSIASHLDTMGHVRREGGCVFSVTPADYSRRPKTNTETVSIIWNAIGSFLVTLVIESNYYVVSANSMPPVSIPRTAFARHGIDLLRVSDFDECTLVVRNMTSKGAFSVESLSDYPEIEIYAEGERIGLAMAHLRDYVADREASGRQILAGLFLSAAYRIGQEAGGLGTVFQLGEHTQTLPHSQYAATHCADYPTSVTEFLDAQPGIERRKFTPSIKFKPGFIQPLHPGFQIVYDALLAHGECVVHSSSLLRDLIIKRLQNDVSSATVIDNMVRTDIVISRFYQRVRHENPPRPPGHSKDRGIAGALTKAVVLAAAKDAQKKRQREDDLLAHARAIQQGETDFHTPPGSPDFMMDDGARTPRDAGLPSASTGPPEIEIIASNFLHAPSGFFDPDAMTFTFPPDYVVDLSKRLWPPSARLLESLVAFSPLTPYGPKGILRDFAPYQPDCSKKPFYPGAIVYVPFNRPSPFAEREQLMLPYSPYWGSINPRSKVEDKLLQPDEAVSAYQHSVKTADD